MTNKRRRKGEEYRLTRGYGGVVSLELDGLDVLELDDDGGLVDEDERLGQRVQQALVGLERAADGVCFSRRYEVFGYIHLFTMTVRGYPESG